MRQGQDDYLLFRLCGLSERGHSKQVFPDGSISYIIKNNAPGYTMKNRENVRFTE